MPFLQCSTIKSGGLVVVSVSGDVDSFTAEALWEELSVQLASSSVVALECVGITFIDSTGLRSLIRTHQYATDQQASFVLVGSNAILNRMLGLAGVSGLIPWFGDVETARVELTGSAD